MARNEDMQVYGIPEIHTERYNHSYTVRRKTSGNIGQIIPIYTFTLVQPGDTISMNCRSFYKLTTSLYPAMDNLTADIFFFAQDMQNVWKNTKNFWGEDEATPFESLPEYEIPQIIVNPTDAVETDDIMHHISLPPMEANKGAISSVARTQAISVERLAYNTYIDIYNRYFRDQNYIPKIPFSDGDENINYADLTQKKLLKAARFHDYFAGAPEPQKGDAEVIPLGTSAPVKSGDLVSDGTPLTGGLRWSNTVTGELFQPETNVHGNTLGINSAPVYDTIVGEQKASDYQLISGVKPRNLFTDLTDAVAATINALRLIATKQQIREELLWYGSRFEEIITSQWGVSMNPTAFRIPEYLGGKRININMDTVLQTSSTDAESPQGNSAGYSVTLDEDHMFTKSFLTWQIIMGVVVIRQDHTYAQGIANQFMKKRKFDYFWKKFEGLGAQPRKVAEIAVTGTASDANVWNYAPAWREYTSEVDRACGLLVPGIPNSLANQTYTDEYSTIPNSGQEWIEETPVYVDRTLVVPSTTTDQMIMDFVFEINKTSIVPNYRLPGIDKL